MFRDELTSGQLTAKLICEFRSVGNEDFEKNKALVPLANTSLSTGKPVEPERMVTRMHLLKEDISYKPIQLNRGTQ